MFQLEKDARYQLRTLSDNEIWNRKILKVDDIPAHGKFVRILECGAGLPQSPRSALWRRFSRYRRNCAVC